MESRGVLSATCWREVELLISIFYYLKSVWRAEPEPPFCGQVIFLQQQRFKCSNENVFGFISYSKLALCMCERVCLCMCLQQFLFSGPWATFIGLATNFYCPVLVLVCGAAYGADFLPQLLALSSSLSLCLSCLSLCHFLCSPFFGRQSFRRVYRRQTDRLRV